MIPVPLPPRSASLSVPLSLSLTVRAQIGDHVENGRGDGHVSVRVFLVRRLADKTDSRFTEKTTSFSSLISSLLLLYGGSFPADQERPIELGGGLKCRSRWEAIIEVIVVTTGSPQNLITPQGNT